MSKRPVIMTPIIMIDNNNTRELNIMSRCDQIMINSIARELYVMVNASLRSLIAAIFDRIVMIDNNNTRFS